MKDLTGWIQGLILTKDAENFTFQACRAGALPGDMNKMSPQAKSPTTVRLKHYDKITAIILALYPTDLFLAP